jgi:hypothetical protein
MNNTDQETISAALQELHGVTGPECKEAHRDEWQVRDRVRVAEEEMQARFRPHWLKIMNIIRRECRKRGVRFLANHCGYQHADHVRIDKEPSAVGINHVEYTVSPYIHIEFWLGYGVSFSWDGYAKSAEAFERKFTVMLATLDGYLSGAKQYGKDCVRCGLGEKDKGKCQRCKVCVDGSMFI